MATFNYKKKVRTCVFISGRGTNLKSIIKSSRDYNFPAKIVLVISNNAKSTGLKYAKKYKIKFKTLNYKNSQNFENKALIELKKNKIELICLAGFMKILTSNFIKLFNKKIINIHPSVLPNYKGLNTHKKVLDKKEIFTGCTVHYVSPKLDSGKIILIKKVNISKYETIKSLQLKVLKQEHVAYPQAIRIVCK